MTWGGERDKRNAFFFSVLEACDHLWIPIGGGCGFLIPQGFEIASSGLGGMAGQSLDKGLRLTGIPKGFFLTNVRLVFLLLGLALMVLIPFFIWGEELIARFGGTGEWLANGGKGWSWLVGLGLLVSDLLMPVPATAVISGLGFVYGVWLGGLIGMTGSFLSGLLAYEACRRGGIRAAEWLLGPDERKKAEQIFAGGTGGWLVALSRWLPILPEMTCCMAGLTRMPRRRFMLALASGCLPMALVFAAIGATGTDSPGLALGLSALAPALLYGAAVWWMRRKKSSADGLEEGKGS
jgi:uncharacterized membrane protein YdjX (TVP38/TMEM64 family)